MYSKCIFLLIKKTIRGTIPYCPSAGNTYTLQKGIQISVKVEENEILHEIFRVLTRFPRYIPCYISENRLPLGQCIAREQFPIEKIRQYPPCSLHGNSDRNSPPPTVGSNFSGKPGIMVCMGFQSPSILSQCFLKRHCHKIQCPKGQR